MAKFKESELDKVLKDYNNIDLEIQFDMGLEGKIKLANAEVEYDEKKGYINIKNPNTTLKINTTLISKYEKNENEIIINIDTLVLKIEK